MRLDRHSSHMRLKLILILIVAVLLVVAFFFALEWLVSRNASPETRGDHTQRYTFEDLITVGGQTYRPRDLCTILLMGIDRKSDATASGFRNGGQADFLQLIIIDQAERKIHRLQIDRDTMTPITVLGVLGKKAGMRTAQISLSHGFGDGKAQSCEFTVEAVSNLLFGFPIDFYIAINMDGISVLNDLLGGVTVTLEDDFSALDPQMVAGATLTLMGKQAEYYVRGRMSIGVGTNEARMARQEKYIASLTDQLGSRISHSKDFIGEVYDEMGPYLLTNMSKGRLINEVWNAREYDRTPLIKPTGEHSIGADGFMQFHVNETELQQIIMSLQYKTLQ